MQVFIGFIILAAIAYAILGDLLFLLIFLGILIWLVCWIASEYNMTPEERQQRRIEQRQQEHAAKLAAIEEARLQRQLEVQAEHDRKRRNASLLGTVAKVGVSLAVKSLTGGNHRHR